MNFFMLILTTVVIHKLSNALDNNTTICDYNGACECTNNRVTCTKFTQYPPYILPNDTVTIHFEDVPNNILNNNTFLNEKLQNITWVASNITFVQTLDLRELEYLDLSKNNIFQLSDNTFKNCLRLKYVDLSYNKLSILPDKLLIHTQYLETVKLENNIFSSIPENLFGITNSVKNLSLGNPNFSVVTENALLHLKNLESLSIENSRIENINKNSFGEHTYLKHILLSNNKQSLVIDNDVIKSAPNIEIIGLNNCSRIKFLPPSIVSLENLKQLQMFETQVEPNCDNGWFSQWFNKTDNVIGYESILQFNEILNQLECPAKIYHISESVTLQLTKKRTINCMAYGNPQPAITWLVPGGITFHENKEADTNISRHPSAHDWDLKQITTQLLLTDKNGSLHILRMLRAHIGNYTCYVSNKLGNDSKTIEVHLDSRVFFNIKINALILGITSALGFLMLTILCCSFKLLLIRYVHQSDNT